MAETLVPLRNALAEAYMGDTKVVKDLFSSHETYDQRMVEILTGLGQHVDVRQPSAISTADIAECLRALNAENQVYRAALMAALSRSFYGKIPVAGITFRNNLVSDQLPSAFPYADYALVDAFLSVSKALYSYTITSRISFDIGAIHDHAVNLSKVITDNPIHFGLVLPFSVPSGSSSPAYYGFPFTVNCLCSSSDGTKSSSVRIPFNCIVDIGREWDPGRIALELFAAETDSTPAYSWKDLWYSTGNPLEPDAFGHVRLDFSFSFTETV